MQILPSTTFSNLVNKFRDSSSIQKLSPSEQLAALDKLPSDEVPLESNNRSCLTASSLPRRYCFNWKAFAIVSFTGFVVGVVLGSAALAVDVTTNPDLVAKLKMAATDLDRMKLLPKDSDWEFDFTKQSNTPSLLEAWSTLMQRRFPPRWDRASPWPCSTWALAPCCRLIFILGRRTMSWP
jgi:hypothetical protein